MLYFVSSCQQMERTVRGKCAVRNTQGIHHLVAALIHRCLRGRFRGFPNTYALAFDRSFKSGASSTDLASLKTACLRVRISQSQNCQKDTRNARGASLRCRGPPTDTYRVSTACNSAMTRGSGRSMEQCMCRCDVRRALCRCE